MTDLDADLFTKLWDELTVQPDVEGVQIVAFRGTEPREGVWNIEILSDSTDPIQQLKDTLDWLRANPYSRPKKRGSKKKGF